MKHLHNHTNIIINKMFATKIVVVLLCYVLIMISIIFLIMYIFMIYICMVNYERSMVNYVRSTINDDTLNIDQH